jgi:hypothetical protein
MTHEGWQTVQIATPDNAEAVYVSYAEVYKYVYLKQDVTTTTTVVVRDSTKVN